MTFGEKLMYSRKKAGLTQEQLAEKIGVAKSTLAGYEKDNREPDLLKIKKIIKELKIDSKYLLGIENDVEAQLSSNESLLLSNYRKLDDRGKNIVDTVMNTELNYIEQVNKQSIKEYSSDNIFNLRMSELKASAGTGNLLSDEVVKYIQVQLNHTTRQADFCIKVSGDSMQPKFYDGDILLVRSQPDIDIGEIGIYIVNSNGFVKKKGSDRLISLNREYDDILLSEFDDIKCCGKVIGKLEKEWIH